MSVMSCRLAGRAFQGFAWKMVVRTVIVFVFVRECCPVVVCSCGSEGAEWEGNRSPWSETTEYSTLSRQSAQSTAAWHHSQDWCVGVSHLSLPSFYQTESSYTSQSACMASFPRRGLWIVIDLGDTLSSCPAVHLNCIKIPRCLYKYIW